MSCSGPATRRYQRDECRVPRNHLEPSGSESGSMQRSRCHTQVEKCRMRLEVCPLNQNVPAEILGKQEELLLGRGAVEQREGISSHPPGRTRPRFSRAVAHPGRRWLPDRADRRSPRELPLTSRAAKDYRNRLFYRDHGRAPNASACTMPCRPCRGSPDSMGLHTMSMCRRASGRPRVPRPRRHALAHD
jgi:hypothetical protein